MHVRVVRFTDVTPERVAQLIAAIDEAGGPPPGVPITGLQLLICAAVACQVRFWVRWLNCWMVGWCAVAVGARDVVRAGAQPYLGPRSGVLPGRRHDG